MRFLQYIVFFIISIAVTYLSAQEQPSSAEALEQYEQITAEMEASFSESDYKTFRRESFSEKELQIYLSLHFQRLDLLPFIKDHHDFKMRSYLHAGNWFREIGFPKESIKWYKEFFDYYAKNMQFLTEVEKEELIEMITFSYSMQAANYAEIDQLDSASMVHKKNIAFVKDVDIILNPSAYNNYGLLYYWSKKDLDSAMIYFHQAYKIAKEKFPEHTLLGSIRDNMADVYIDTGQPEKALPLYQENFELYSNVKNEKSKQFDVPRLVSAGAQLIETQLKLNQIDAARQSFNTLLKIIERPEFKKEVRGSTNLEFLKAEEALYRSQQQFEKAYAIASRREVIKDSLNALAKIADKKWQDELNTISLDRVALNFKIDRIENENKINSQRSKLWIVSLSSIIILILLTSLFLRRRQILINTKNKQRLAEQELEVTALKNKQLQSEIESKKRDLSDFAINLTQNQEWAQELADKIASAKRADTADQEQLLAELEQEIQNKITVDGDTKEFFERLDKLSDAFYSELTKRFPNLSKNEIRLCSLIRLKMDSRSIATLQNITLASLNTSRYRLRKKLNLTEEVDLDDFIQNI